jgi:3-oxoadipate enol-lactonase
MPTFERDGVTLHYELDGTGTPVVYICGFSSHSNDVLGNILRPIFSQQHQVLTVDNRGSGQTIVPEGCHSTVEDMADDVAALMDHHGMSNAQVLGVSMGGAIAMTLALRHPEKVKSLILAVTFAHRVANSRAEYMLSTSRLMREASIPAQLIRRYVAVFLLAEDLFSIEPFMQVWENAQPDPYEQTSEGSHHQLAALVGYDLRDKLAQINVPTLVISSPDDMLVPPRFQDEIAAGIPNAQIKRYPGGHIFMVLPMYAPQFIQDVMGFWAANA